MSSSNKRALSPPSSSLPPSKRSSTSGQSLSSWLKVPPPKAPPLLASSPPLTDRQSTFVAHVAPCTNSVQATQFHDYVRSLRDPTSHPTAADHEMMAWRAVVLKPGKDGLREEDFVVKYGSEDDGEKNGGNTLRKALEEEAAVDVVVVVSRYYGGIMLGPDRFAHMRTVTSQALALLSASQLRLQLQRLDSEIDDLVISPLLYSPGTKLPMTPNYEKMPVATLERLVKAREKRRDFLRGEVGRKEEERRRERDGGGEEGEGVLVVQSRGEDGGAEGAGDEEKGKAPDEGKGEVGT